MTLTPGTKLGPYEIIAPAGAGGMGEVYRARDTRLDRTVAIKILPATFSSDLDRLHRFQHEAKILSTLNHPNVLAIYDVGDQDGVRFLVSEFLEGQTLREKMETGALSRWRLIEYALEIAKGLAAAHEKGVVHRDLKPDNVFITRDDRVKVLDFGLAKLTQSGGAPEQTATLTGPAPTTPGTVMGTVGYMSPEQVRGHALDSRSDIFSFGAVLYEMASGRRAFRGDSSVETMNAILKEDVAEISASGANASPGLERIIRRCLEKKPERRFQSASDLAFALEALSGSSTVASVVSGPVPLAAARKPWLAWALAGFAVLALAAAGLWRYTHPRSVDWKFTQITFRSAYIRTARFAPGRTVIYGANINANPTEIFSTRTDTIESQPLNLKADLLGISSTSEMAVALDRAFTSVWVPTGRLARAPLGGGSTRELLDDVTDADWNKDGSQLAVARRVNGLFRLEYPLGKVLYETSGYISDLRFSPSGDQIAFLDHPVFGDDRGYVDVIDPQGRRKVLAGEFATEQGVAWSASGKEIWFTGSEGIEPNSLRAVDLGGRQRVVMAAPTRLHLQDIAADGRVLLSSELLRWQIGTADIKTGQQRDLTSFQWPEIEAISGDGSMILLNSFDISLDGNYRLYIQRTDGSPPVQIGEGAGSALSFDGKWAAAFDPAHPEKASIIPTGLGDAKAMQAPSGFHYIALALLPDNKRLLTTMASPGQPRQSAIQDLEGGAVHNLGTAGRFIPSLIGVMTPGPSPDGKFCILTDGIGGYWLQPLDGTEGREIRGVAPDERIIEWHADSNNVFVMRPDGSDAEVYTLNLATGQRKPWTRFTPADKTATLRNSWLIISRDGNHYAHQVQRVYSTLFLADGLR